MVIYGTLLLAICHLLGYFLGHLLGYAIGINKDVGGVGIAMIFLIVARIVLHRQGLMPKSTEMGVSYWGAMYIPIVVAMAAQLNVVAAMKGGYLALIAAVGSVVVCTCFIAAINRLEPADAAFEETSAENPEGKAPK